MAHAHNVSINDGETYTYNTNTHAQVHVLTSYIQLVYTRSYSSLLTSTVSGRMASSICRGSCGTLLLKQKIYMYIGGREVGESKKSMVNCVKF